MSTTQTPPNTDTGALAAALARWRTIVEAELKGAPFDKKLVTRTPEGVAVQPLYTRLDLAGLPNLEAQPGQAPFLRGVRPVGYQTTPWEFAQEIAARTPAEFNAALKADLMHGQNAVVLTPDVAARAGLDPDEATPAQVGAGGLSLATVDEIGAAIEGADLTAVPLHVEAGADALPIASLLIEYARTHGAPAGKLSGSITADPLGHWAATGHLPTGLDSLYDSLAGWTAWASKNSPSLKTIGVNAALWGDAGATATQELAFALAAAAEYLRAVSHHSVPVAVAVGRFEFKFAVGPQFFTEVAKFRAFRPLWTRVVSAFGVAPDYAGKASVRASTGRWNKTLLDPHVNMLRVTTEALSAVLGGVDALHIAPFDEVTGATNDFSRRIARNLHTLLAEEFNFAVVADPAGGSWYVEKLTDELARKAWALFQDIEGKGGLAAALRSGYAQQLVAKSAADKRDGVAKRRVGLVGTNLFPNLREKPFVAAPFDAAAFQAKRSSEVSAHRGAPAKAAARRPRTLAPALSSAKEGATVGQLSKLFHAGAPAEAAITPVTSRRASEDFEELRAASAAFADLSGNRPKVFLAKMGPVLQHKARADFAAGFFAVGGFETLAKKAFETAEAAAQAAVESGASVAVLCSTDDTYPTLVPAFAKAVKAGNPKITVVLAGLPAEPAVVAAYKEAGIDEFIHIRANVYELLANLLKKIGATA